MLQILYGVKMDTELYVFDKNYLGRIKYEVKISLYGRDAVPGRWVDVYKGKADPKDLLRYFIVFAYDKDDNRTKIYVNYDEICNTKQLVERLKLLKKNANKFARKQIPRYLGTGMVDFADAIISNMDAFIKERVADNEQYEVEFNQHDFKDCREAIKTTIRLRNGDVVETHVKLNASLNKENSKPFSLIFADAFKSLEFSIIKNGKLVDGTNVTLGMSFYDAKYAFLEALHKHTYVSKYNLNHTVWEQFKYFVVNDTRDANTPAEYKCIIDDSGFLVDATLTYNKQVLFEHLKHSVRIERLNPNNSAARAAILYRLNAKDVLQNFNIVVTKDNATAMNMNFEQGYVNLSAISMIVRTLNLKKDYYESFIDGLVIQIINTLQQECMLIPEATAKVLDDLDATYEQKKIVEQDFQRMI